jgi:alcohol dehydrogenase
MALTYNTGVDVAIEAVGNSATFDICQAIIAPGGHLANVGVYGQPVELHLERLWASNITLTTRLVDAGTTPMLLKMVQSGHIDAKNSSAIDLSYQKSWKPTKPLGMRQKNIH